MQTMQDLSHYRQIVPAHLPSLPLQQKDELPDIPAVYFALGETSQILYIGKSVSLNGRWKGHHRQIELERIGNVRLAWIEFETEEFLEEVERVLISHFSPAMNGWRDRTNTKEFGVYVRLSATEKEALQIAAQRDDRTMADWVRCAARQKLRRMGLLPDIEEELEKDPRRGL